MESRLNASDELPDVQRTPKRIVRAWAQSRKCADATHRKRNLNNAARPAVHRRVVRSMPINARARFDNRWFISVVRNGEPVALRHALMHTRTQPASAFRVLATADLRWHVRQLVHASVRGSMLHAKPAVHDRCSGGPPRGRDVKGGIFLLWKSANRHVSWNLVYWSCLISSERSEWSP